MLASLEPPEEPIVWDREDDEYPERTRIRAILRERMPYARHVTAERMADAKAECARQGIDTTDFEEIWTRRIIAWIAEQTLCWFGLMVDDEKAPTPWLMDLASCTCSGGWPPRRPRIQIASQGNPGPGRAATAVTRAMRMLEPSPKCDPHVLDADGKSLFVVDIEPASNGPVLMWNGQVVIRKQAATRAANV